MNATQHLKVSPGRSRAGGTVMDQTSLPARSESGNTGAQSNVVEHLIINPNYTSLYRQMFFKKESQSVK